MIVYTVLLVFTGILVALLSIKPLLLIFSIMTFGLGFYLAAAAASALVVLILGAPGRVLALSGNTAIGLALSLILIGGAAFGPGLLRMAMESTAVDVPAEVAGKPIAPPRSAEIDNRELISETVNASKIRGMRFVCDEDCETLLRIEGLDWVRIRPPHGAAHIVTQDSATGRITVQPDNGKAADLRIIRKEENKRHGKHPTFQLWTARTFLNQLEIIDQRASEQVVLRRVNAEYNAVAMPTFVVPAITWNSGSGAVGGQPWAWHQRPVSFGGPKLRDLETESESLNIPRSEPLSGASRDDAFRDLLASYILFRAAASDEKELHLGGVAHAFLTALRNRPATDLERAALAALLGRDKNAIREIFRAAAANDILFEIAEPFLLTNLETYDGAVILANTWRSIDPDLRVQIAESFDAAHGIIATYQTRPNLVRTVMARNAHFFEPQREELLRLSLLPTSESDRPQDGFDLKVSEGAVNWFERHGAPGDRANAALLAYFERRAEELRSQNAASQRRFRTGKLFQTLKKLDLETEALGILKAHAL